MFSGRPTVSNKDAIQTNLSEFKVEAQFQEAWATGLQLLGKPLSARLTSRANIQFLDIYFQ